MELSEDSCRTMHKFQGQNVKDKKLSLQCLCFQKLLEFRQSGLGLSQNNNKNNNKKQLTN